MTLKISVILLILTAIFADGAKILGIFQRPSRSHHVLGSTLFKALVKRGHQVTMLSPFPLEVPVKNYEDIELTVLREFNQENDVIKKYIQQQNSSIFEKLSVMTKTMDTINEIFLNHTVVKDLLRSNRTFDLVILNWSGNEAYLGLAHHFEASTIAFSTIGSTFLTNTITQSPAPYSYIPSMFPMFPDEMTFMQRVGNTLTNTLWELFYHLHTSPREEHLRQKYFPKAPSCKELRSNISLVLLNSHYSIESPRPYVPSTIQVGGFHVKEPQELEGDLKKFLDSAVNGAIFFSLGSNVKSSDLPKAKLEAIVASFGKLSLKVLWKFEGDNFPNLPSNVKIGKWLPQRDILAHPNIKLFVTHGGFLSTIEAVYHGVPMVGIPLFGDQESNVDDGVNKGYAVKVPFLDLSEVTLTTAYKEVLSNPKYRENVKRRSLVLKDQPLKPLDTAVFWIEYVLRHKGAHHLKTSALKLQWYQYYLLDVAAFLFLTILVICVSIYLLLRCILKLLARIFASFTSEITSQEKKNV